MRIATTHFRAEWIWKGEFCEDDAPPVVYFGVVWGRHAADGGEEELVKERGRHIGNGPKWSVGVGVGVGYLKEKIDAVLSRYHIPLMTFRHLRTSLCVTCSVHVLGNSLILATRRNGTCLRMYGVVWCGVVSCTMLERKRRRRVEERKK